MINALLGRPRSGKSYEAVRYHIIDAVKKGRMVVTNIPVNVDRIRLVYGDDAANLIVIVKTDFGDYGSIRPFSKAEDFTKYEWRDDSGLGPLFVIDEMHLNCGNQADKGLLEYLSMHGHHGHDIICLTQSPRKLHRDLRDMVEISWRCSKMTAFGKDTGYFRKTYHGISTNNSDFIDNQERTYDPEFFPFYKSHTLSANSVTETVANDIKGSLNPHKRMSTIMIGLGVVFSLYTGYNMIWGSKDVKEEKTKDTVVTKAAVDSTVVNSPVRTQQQLVIDNSIELENIEKRTRIVERLKSRADDYHPYYKVSLHVDGRARYIERGVTYDTVYFVAAQNGQAMFRLDNSDLLLAGYDVQVLGDCMVSISYFDYQDFLTCDSPSVTITSNTESDSNPS